MTETHIAGELYGLSAHPGDIYHRAAMTVEALVRERDEALAEAALSEKSYEEAYGEAYDEGLQEGLSGAASAASDLWSMLLRHFHKYGVEPASDDGEGHSAYQMMDALHEHEREVDMAHKAEVERLTRERDEARADALSLNGQLQIAGRRFEHADAAVMAAETRIAELTRERDEARSTALEEAAKVAEGQPVTVWSGHVTAATAYGMAKRDIAESIRALKEPAASLRKPVFTKPNCPNLEEGKHD
jgi:hypothetical protein